jgi:glycosyltransferase involved in cell wall biosynthesis
MAAHPRAPRSLRPRVDSLMRIGVDATCWANGRGYGRFARELLRAMVVEGAAHEFVCFVDERAARCFDLTGASVRMIVVPQSASPTTAASADGNRSVGDMWRMTRAVARERLDVFFSPSVYTYFPLPPSLAAVITFHDAIADRFPKLTLPSPRARLFWRVKVKMALAQSRIVLTVSDYAADEVSRTLGVRRERIRVAVEAAASIYQPSESPDQVDAAARRAGVPAGRRWMAYVGGFNPHKHVDVIVRAHAALVRDVPDPPVLVLVGAIDDDPFFGSQRRIREEIERCGTAEHVCWAGFVPDEELRHLLSGALALVLPSESEGFGLPAVEAAACGVPVIATTESPLPQLLAGGGIFVAPRDEVSLGMAMRRLATDEEHRLILAAAALTRARALSWESSARAALGALTEAAA